MTVINGLWLGTLLWLVLGVWLDVANFISCWIGATVFSWIVAIIRQGRAIDAREENHLGATDREGESSLDEDTAIALSKLAEGMQSEHGRALTIIRPQIERLLKHDNGALAPALRQRGLNHNTIVLAAAKFILDSELPSGNHHRYRGVLSQNGNALPALYVHAVERLWTAEPHQEVSADAEIDSINEAISKAG